MPRDKVSIRPARVNDVESVIGLWNEAAEPTVANDRTSIQHLLERDPDALLVAEREGRIVGTLVAAWDGWRGNMYRLAVLSEYRRGGIGLKLVRFAEERLIGLGAQRITALVVESHDDATRLWRAAGYEHDLRMARYMKTIDRGKP